MTSLNKLLCAILILAAQLIFISSVAHSQTPDPKPKATGSISGRVTVGGKGAAGIVVAAVSLDNLNRRTATARATTDNEGNYRLAGLPAGQYQVAPLTPDMTAGDTDADANFGFIYMGFGASKNIILAAGEVVENIDVKLVRGAVITGRVTDADNKPVVEERITLQPVDQNGNPSRTSTRLPINGQMYQTDDRGIYRIYGLTAGRYKVSVGNDPNGGIFLNSRGYFLRTFYPNTTDETKASVVDVAEGGEASNVDIQVGSRADTYTVTGHMIDSESGLPISGVRVGYLLKRQNEQRYLPFMIMGATGASGEFRTDGLSPGKYGAYAFPESESGGLFSDPVYFEVIDKDISGIEIKTVRGLSIGGVVAGDSQMPKDLLAQLPGLRISANIDPGATAAPVGSGSSTISPDGSFLISGLRPGRVSMNLYSISGKRPSIVRIDHNGIGITQGFELQPGQSVSGLRVIIVYGSGVIRGSVHFEGGTPSPQSRAYISYALEGTRGGAGAQIDARGHFMITGLSPGNYTLTLQSGGPGQRPSSQKQTVTVANDNEAQVTFVVDLTPKEGGP